MAKEDTADAALLEIALEALASCDSMLSFYYYSCGNAMFNQVGLPDKQEVGDIRPDRSSARFDSNRYKCLAACLDVVGP